MSNDDNDKKQHDHHGIVIRLAGDEHGPTHDKGVDPICVSHADDEACPIRACDEVVYEAPSETASTSVGWSPAYSAGWDRVFGKMN